MEFGPGRQSRDATLPPVAGYSGTPLARKLGPKTSAGVPTDLAFAPVQRAGLDLGLVDNKVCAVDEVWSGLRFVYRLKDR